jgi:hypothetical protein
MAGHVSSTDLLNCIHILDIGGMTLSGVSSSAMKTTNDTCICFVVKLNILLKYCYKILLVKTYTFVLRSTT